MLIKFTNYSNGIHYFTLEKAANKMNLPPEFESIVKVDCKMDKSNHQIVLDCKINAVINLKCDRCLEEYKHIVDTEFRLVFIFSTVKTESEDLDLQFLAPDVTKIDITEEVIEYCFLSIPLKQLCDEECKGLCSSCGINLNIETCNCNEPKANTVWDKLNNLKD